VKGVPQTPEGLARRLNRPNASSNLNDSAQLAGWPTPKASEADKDSRTTQGAEAEVARNKGPSLSATVVMAGWPTTTTRDYKDGTAKSCENVPSNALLGRVVHTAGPTPSGISAVTASTAASRLNPRFSLWLMGYPDGWASCGERAMPSSRKSRKRS